MLCLVGLGLSDETDITVKGLEIVREAARVYLEAYTSVLLVEQSVLESYYGRPVILADREMVESNSDEILRGADVEDVAFLVVGDPFGATTHTDLVLRARQLSIPVRTVPNASIMSAIGATGLQLYSFGQTVSMVFFTESWRPTSFYDRVRENLAAGLHTLILLDIKVKEPTLESLARGGGRRTVYEPPRFMTVGTCARQMLEVVAAVGGNGGGIGGPNVAGSAGTAGSADAKGDGETTEIQSARPAYGPDSLAVGAARVGGRTEKFVAGTLAELCGADAELGDPLHSLVLLGSRTHALEHEFVREFAMDRDKWDSIWKADYGK